MLTSKLEDLIWQGKAFPKTFCVGGTQKHVIDIQPDRFIIITDILYFPFFAMQPDPEISNVFIPDIEVIGKYIASNHISTQLTILGEKNYNRFQFRNNVNFVSDNNGTDSRFLAIPQTPTHLDTYLIHTTGVSFTFSYGVGATPTDGPTLASSTAFSNPVDYGKQGDLIVDNTTQISDVSIGPTTFENYVSRTAPAGTPTTNELAYPVNSFTNITSDQRVYGNQHPIVQVSYIEILGQPNNIGL